MKHKNRKTARPALAFALALTFALLLVPTPAYGASVQVALPGFPVALNGVPIDNAARRYPLITYRDITYFPMTYADCRFLGLESVYSEQDGLTIDRTGVAGAYSEDKATGRNPQRGTAQTAAFPIRVNGTTINNSGEEYPLLLYQDVTYFPLTWRFAVDEFGWDYSFDASRGLVIRSTAPTPAAPPSPEQIVGLLNESMDKLHGSEWLSLTLRDYSRYNDRVIAEVREHRPGETKWFRSEGDQYLQLDGSFYYSNDGDAWGLLKDTDPMLDDAVNRALENLLHAFIDLPTTAFADAWVDDDEGYPRLRLSYMDAEPSSLPEKVEVNGGLKAGTFESHIFYFDLQERCLRSYWTYGNPFYYDDNGDVTLVAPPTTWYTVADLDYRPFTLPKVRS